MEKKKIYITVSGILVLLLILIYFIWPKGVTTKTFAGSGDIGIKDGLKSAADFNCPHGLAIDNDGSLIVADTENNLIRRIKDDKITTIAGNTQVNNSLGYPDVGYTDGDASTARFNKPRNVISDKKGSIFVSDTGNNVIRKITGSRVYTFAGNGKSGYMDGKGPVAMFNKPLGICIDKEGNLYVADCLNNVIRRVNAKGEVSTYAGKCSEEGGYKDGPLSDAMFNEPSGMVMSDDGTLYILDCGNQLIRKIENDKVTTLSGIKGDLIPGTSYTQGEFENGSLNQAKYNFPKGITIDPKGTLYIADTWNNRIRVITTSGKVSTIAGSDKPGKKEGPLTLAEFDGPVDVLYYDGMLYVSDMWNNCIRSFQIN